MSIRCFYSITKLLKITPQFLCLERNFSRKVNNADDAFKPIKPRRAPEAADSSNLVWRDPNFEILASNEFPLFLPGHVGLAWYDTHTTGKTHYELIMENLDDTKVDNADVEGSIICRVQTCPKVLRQTVCDLFPYRTLENSELSVVTISLRPNVKLMRKNKELETERMAQAFLLAAKNVCDKLRTSGYWADFINPFSGRPYLVPTSAIDLYETDEKFRCLDFQIFEIKDCKIISNEENSKQRFIGSLFTNAPCRKNNLNSIFTKK